MRARRDAEQLDLSGAFIYPEGSIMLCTIAFQEEAYESAATILRQLQGYAVHVVPTAGEPFDATLGPVTDDDDGQYRASLKRGDTSELLDIYADIERIEVL